MSWLEYFIATGQLDFFFFFTIFYFHFVTAFSYNWKILCPYADILYSHYFAWQLLVATSCLLICCINMAHLVDCPHAGRVTVWSDKW